MTEPRPWGNGIRLLDSGQIQDQTRRAFSFSGEVPDPTPSRSWLCQGC